jgi:hypothetical protein
VGTKSYPVIKTTRKLAQNAAIFAEGLRRFAFT